MLLIRHLLTPSTLHPPTSPAAHRYTCLLPYTDFSTPIYSDLPRQERRSLRFERFSIWIPQFQSSFVTRRIQQFITNTLCFMQETELACSLPDSSVPGLQTPTYRSTCVTILTTFRTTLSYSVDIHHENANHVPSPNHRHHPSELSKV